MPKFRLLAWLDTSAHAIRGGFCKYIRPVDLQDSDLGLGDKKSSENDQLTGHFQSFFFYISRTNSKNSKVNQQSV